MCNCSYTQRRWHSLDNIAHSADSNIELRCSIHLYADDTVLYAKSNVENSVLMLLHPPNHILIHNSININQFFKLKK